MAPGGYCDPLPETDLMRVNTPTEHHSKDKDISCGHFALMITEALMATRAPAHISCLLCEAGPRGCPAKAVYLLIRCHCADR